MTEEEARAWIGETFAGPVVHGLERYVSLLITGSSAQNLISASSRDRIWARHIMDSAQLVLHADHGPWIDVGSGAGLPGIVVALCNDIPVTLVEPRRLRASFLQDAVDVLGLGARVSIIQMKSQNHTANAPAATISARAVATVDQVLQSTAHLSNARTRWILPKGGSAQLEVENARKSWHGVFHVKPSLTEPGAGIVTAQGVRRR